MEESHKAAMAELIRTHQDNCTALRQNHGDEVAALRNEIEKEKLVRVVAKAVLKACSQLF